MKLLLAIGLLILSMVSFTAAEAALIDYADLTIKPKSTWYLDVVNRGLKERIDKGDTTGKEELSRFRSANLA
jgi:hypothetical protein